MVARTTEFAEPRARRWSRDEYHRMGDLGWFHDERVELIGGEVIVKFPRVSPELGPRARLWSRDEYYEMAKLGWFEGQRVELIGGEVVEMSPQASPHAAAIGLAQIALQSAVGPNYWVRIQLPLSLGQESEPEPDLAVVKGSVRDFEKAHPKSAVLVVEVSENTLRFDSTRKASLYAAAGIRDYWILNLWDDCVEVLRDPIRDPAAPFGWRYGSRAIMKRGDQISPLAIPDKLIAVDDLLPFDRGRFGNGQ